MSWKWLIREINFFYLIDCSFYSLEVTKDSDEMRIQILIVVAYHRLLDRTEIVKKNALTIFAIPYTFQWKLLKKLSKFSLTSHIQKSMTIKECNNSRNFPCRSVNLNLLGSNWYLPTKINCNCILHVCTWFRLLNIIM